MTTAKAKSDDERPPRRGGRERGTPRGPLPDGLPIALIAFANVVSAMLATSTLSPYPPSEEGGGGDVVVVAAAAAVRRARVASVACLGAATTSIGMVYSDSITHALAFGISMLLVAIDDGIPSALAVASPPLILVALSSVRGPTRSAMNSFDWVGGGGGGGGGDILPFVLTSVCVVPFAMAMHACIAMSNIRGSSTEHDARSSSSVVGTSPLASSCPTILAVCLATMLVMRAYHDNRSHRNGNLLTSDMKSRSIFAGMSMIASICIAMSGWSRRPTATTSFLIIAFLLGSLFVSLLCHVFAAVADVWYAVGSGQFHMVSLDTLGMMLFFAYPALLLHSRFLDMHAEDVSYIRAMLGGGYSRFIDVILPSYSPSYSAYDSGEDALAFGLAMMLVATSSVVGVPLLTALCPMGGYLYSRAFTHGRPNTMRMALCVNYCDLPVDEVARENVWESLRRRRRKDGDKTIAAVLNVFVTSEDMARYPDELRVIVRHGHAVELAPVESSSNDAVLLSVPSIFRGDDGVRDLRDSQREYARLFGDEGAGPSWMLSRSASSLGRHPSVLREASYLGMKVAYWSTLIRLNEGRLTSEQRSAIDGDSSDKNGGSIIYVVLKKGVSSNSASGSLCELIATFDGRCSLESLSDVARDDAEMVLKS